MGGADGEVLRIGEGCERSHESDDLVRCEVTLGLQFIHDTVCEGEEGDEGVVRGRRKEEEVRGKRERRGGEGGGEGEGVMSKVKHIWGRKEAEQNWTHRICTHTEDTCTNVKCMCTVTILCEHIHRGLGGGEGEGDREGGKEGEGEGERERGRGRGGREGERGRGRGNQNKGIYFHIVLLV